MFMRIGDPGGVDNLRRFVGLQTKAASQGEYRIEHSADGVRKRLVTDDRNRIRRRVAAAEKTRTIGVELNPADDLTRACQHVNSPRGWIFRGTRTPPREQRVVAGLEFRLDEKVAESRM